MVVTSSANPNKIEDRNRNSNMTAALEKTAQTRQDLNIGLSQDDRQIIATGLCRILANSYTLYLKTHNFHWNVTGPLFHSLHEMFEEQYTDLAEAVDELAERIRALGSPAPGTYKEFAQLSAVQEVEGVPDAADMIRYLTADNETLSREARPILMRAEQAEDQPTADLLTRRMQAHEKNAWMLRSMLD